MNRESRIANRESLHAAATPVVAGFLDSEIQD